MAKDTKTNYIKLKKKGGNFVLYDKFEEGLKVYKEALPLCEKIYGTSHAETADLYNRMGVVHLNLGHYSTGKEWFVKSRDMYRALNADDHLGLAQVYGNLGVLCGKLGQQDEALKNYLLAKKIREGRSKKPDKDTARLYLNIGNLYINKGKYDTALEWAQKAYDILRKKIFDSNKYDYASSCNSIALIHKKTVSHESALQWYFKSIKSAKRTIKTTKSLLVTIYGNVSAIYREKRDFPSALDYQKKALDLCNQIYGKNHPKLANIYSEMGSTHYRQKEFEQAGEYAIKAASIRENSFGKTHQLTALAYSNAGLYNLQMGNYEKGFEYYDTAISIYSKLYGEKSEKYLTPCENMASTCFSAKQYKQCAKIYESTLKPRIKSEGEKSENVASLYNKIGQCYEAMNSEDSIVWYEKSIELNKHIFGKNHRILINQMTILANAYYKFEKYEQSLKYYNQILDTVSVDKSTNFDLLLHIYLGKTAVLKKSGHTGDAVKTLEEALSIFKKYKAKEQSVFTLTYNLAFACSMGKDYANALKHFETALAIIEKLKQDETSKKNEDIYSYICREMAVIYLHVYSDYMSSVLCFEKCILQYSENHPDTAELAQLYKDAAFPYFKLAQYDKAQEYCIASRDIFLKYYEQTYEKITDINRILEHIYNKQYGIEDIETNDGEESFFVQ